MRYVVAGAFAAGAALVIFYAAELGLFERRQQAAPAAPGEVAYPNQISGSNATIAGTGKDNQPFEVTAKSGVQDLDQETLVHLQTVNGLFQRPTGNKLNVTAARATYDTQTKQMALDGEVVFDEAGRFRAVMDGATVNTETQTLQSRSPVKVEVIGGTITADSFSVGERGERMIFKGGVKARFVTEGAQTGDGE
jgi:lipopolysaccharide export system protein LptC